MNPPLPIVHEGVEFFATIINGKIRGVGQAIWPPHELKPNQFVLTEKEFRFLHKLTNLDEALPILEGVQKKVKEVMKNETTLHLQDS